MRVTDDEILILLELDLDLDARGDGEAALSFRGARACALARSALLSFGSLAWMSPFFPLVAGWPAQWSGTARESGARRDERLRGAA